MAELIITTCWAFVAFIQLWGRSGCWATCDKHEAVVILNDSRHRCKMTKDKRRPMKNQHQLSLGGWMWEMWHPFKGNHKTNYNLYDFTHRTSPSLTALQWLSQELASFSPCLASMSWGTQTSIATRCNVIFISTDLCRLAFFHPIIVV